MAQYTCAFIAAGLLVASTATTAAAGQTGQAPVITAPVDRAVFQVDVNQHLRIEVVGRDPDPDGFGFTMLPSTALSPPLMLSTGALACTPACSGQQLIFDWMPAPGMEGVHPVRFEARDPAGNVAGINVTIIVGAGPGADLAVTQTATPATALVGDTVTYSVSVVNNGPMAAGDARLSVTLSPGQTFFSASPAPGWTCGQPSPDRVECLLGHLMPATSAAVVVQATADTPGTVSAASDASSTTFDPDPVNHRATTAVTVAAPWRPGGNQLWAWGNNMTGQLGNGGSGGNVGAGACCLARPQLVLTMADAIAAAAGPIHGLAARADGSVWAWGENLWGALGDGTQTGSVSCFAGTCRSMATRVSNLTDAVAVAAGWNFSLALKADGSVWAWGRNEPFGQLGIGASLSGTGACQPTVMGDDCSVVPRRVVFPAQAPPVKAVAASVVHSLALGQDGTVWAWGSNRRGELGTGSSAISVGAPVGPILTDVIGVSAAEHVSLAVRTDGSVWGWGNHQSGQLGSGISASLAGCNPVAPPWCAGPTPVQVSGIGGVVAVAAAPFHALALKSDGTVWAWGLNDAGQLGIGTLTGGTCPNHQSQQCLLTPVQVRGLTDVVAIAAHDSYSLAIARDGTVWAWGVGDGTLGDGMAGQIRSTPTQVINLTGAGFVSAGSGSVMTTGAETGASILVRPDEGGRTHPGITVRFASIAMTGVTQVSTSPVGASPPAGFQHGSQPAYYDLTTTAMHAAPIRVCVEYGTSAFSGPPRLFHWEETPAGTGIFTWVDRTVSLDPLNTTVCGETVSLGTFAVFSQ